MTPAVLAILAVAGGIGSATRFLVDGLIKSRFPSSMPVGTIVINLTGSLALGFLVGLTINHAAPESLHLIIGTGFLGGYTTFSTASFETVRLLQERRWIAGAVNGFGVLIATVALAGLGLWAGTQL